MAVPPKDGASRPCGGVAPNFKCDQMATYRAEPPQRSKLASGPSATNDRAGAAISGPTKAHRYPGWCCPLGHFEAHEPD
jgi:hypothetical protein